MIYYLERLLKFMRPAFKRKATFVWFIIAFIGFITRYDTYGVSSIIRALLLLPSCYPCLLHFFHSSAWTCQSLASHWWNWLSKANLSYTVRDRKVLLGDHTKVVKDGRRMPGVSTLHQDSETGSKPSFFRGHHWGFIGILLKTAKKQLSVPLWAEIHNDIKQSRAVRIVTIALQITQAMGFPSYLILDAFFATGPVFSAVAHKTEHLHILTRAKKNIVAYLSPLKKQNGKAGRPRIYGTKIKLMKLFDIKSHKFKKIDLLVYNKLETVKFFTVDLIWKPVKQKLHFILVESSRGRIILMTSDFKMDVVTAVQLYCYRVSIESFFDTLKNLLGGMKYHFWSKYLEPASRRVSKKNRQKQISTNKDKTKNTLCAIEKFVLVQIIVVGTLQLLACKFPATIIQKSNCWLRTPCCGIPSEFVTRVALTTIIRRNLFIFAKNWITHLIRKKQKCKQRTGLLRKVA